jgi:hypothetical protein
VFTETARLFDPKLEYVNPPDAVEPGTRHGLAAFSRAVHDMVEGWESFEAAGLSE